ncbi:LamG domain-containing protein [Halovenus rubra]|uniref:LamG domain-containing protein n=2 Tax=Halovenus rubra TaxID=869890 RepID=A0ABD5X4P0_9EURY|nr:LamG domain-containing protein [Halovenus rubra]
MSGFRTDSRSASPVIGNLLLVAIILVLGTVIFTVSATFLNGYGTPTADAAFEFTQSPAGLVLQPQALGTDIVVKLDGTEIERLASDEVGTSILLPTAPGSQITVVSQDEQQSVLLREEVDDRDRLGDFTAYYTFEQGADSDTLQDLSGNGNDGTLVDEGGGNGPEWGGCGLQFDGVNDRVDITDISAPVNVSEFTVVVKYTQTGKKGSINQLIEHQFSGGNEWFFETSPSNNGGYTIDYAVEFPDEVVASGAVSTNTTHVVVGTFDGNSYDLYVDGNRIASGSHSASVGMGDLRLGRDFESSSQYFDGALCELRLYYTAFDSNQIEQITTVLGS